MTCTLYTVHVWRDDLSENWTRYTPFDHLQIETARRVAAEEQLRKQTENMVPLCEYNELKDKHDRFNDDYYRALVEMSKAREAKQEIEGSYEWAFLNQLLQAEERSGQFKIMFKEWSRMRSALSVARDALSKQTENMLALRKFVEYVANTGSEDEPCDVDAIACEAQDLLAKVTG